MYCRPCNLHFSEWAAAGRCPSCGRTGAGTPVEGGLAASQATGAPQPPPRAGGPPVDELTRTEMGAADRWEPGPRVAGKYEVIDPGGSGDFGTVYKVRHIFRKKYYALKTPHPQFAKDEVFRRRFEREIE